MLLDSLLERTYDEKVAGKKWITLGAQIEYF